MSLSQHRQVKENQEVPVPPVPKSDSLLSKIFSIREGDFSSFYKIFSIIFITTTFVSKPEYFKPIATFILNKVGMISPSAWVLIASTGFSILFFTITRYLDSERNSTNKLTRSIEEELARRESRLNYTLNHLTKKDLDAKFDALTQLINLQEPAISLSDEQKHEVYQAILSSTSSNLTKEFFDGLKDSVKSQIIEDKREQLTLLNRRSELSVSRLRDEIKQLSKRADTNLAIGSTVTIAALVALSYFILSENFNSVDVQKVALHFIPRLSLVVFIEFFSFFFLKLYRASLHEIKYYQNELTNLEVRATAVAFAVNYGKEDDISLVIKELSSVERNFKLQKDESTVELERNKAETHDLKEILKAALGAVPKKEK